jgi:hypothetical protein
MGHRRPHHGGNGQLADQDTRYGGQYGGGDSPTSDYPPPMPTGGDYGGNAPDNGYGGAAPDNGYGGAAPDNGGTAPAGNDYSGGN